MTAMPNLDRMVWDFADRLRIVERGTMRVINVYDASGARMRKVVEKNDGSVIEERQYLGAVEYDLKHNGTETPDRVRETVHVMDDETRIALVETHLEAAAPSPLIRYQFSDHLGSASLELDETAAFISYEEYYPYGATSFQTGRNAAEVSLKRYRYTGMERDEETGLALHGARYYAPWLGRWTAADPAGLVDGPNLYRYAGGNPILNLDSTGTNSEKSGLLGYLRGGRGWGRKFHQAHMIVESQLKRYVTGYSRSKSQAAGELTKKTHYKEHAAIDAKIRRMLKPIKSIKSRKQLVRIIKDVEAVWVNHGMSRSQARDWTLANIPKLGRIKNPEYPKRPSTRNGQKGSASLGIMSGIALGGALIPLIAEGRHTEIGILGGNVGGAAAASKVLTKAGSKVPGPAKIVAMVAGSFVGGCVMGGECNPGTAAKNVASMVYDDFTERPVTSFLDYAGFGTYSATSWVDEKTGLTDRLAGLQSPTESRLIELGWQINSAKNKVHKLTKQANRLRGEIGRIRAETAMIKIQNQLDISVMNAKSAALDQEISKIDEQLRALR